MLPAAVCNVLPFIRYYRQGKESVTKVPDPAAIRCEAIWYEGPGTEKPGVKDNGAEDPVNETSVSFIVRKIIQIIQSMFRF